MNGKKGLNFVKQTIGKEQMGRIADRISDNSTILKKKGPVCPLR